MSALSRSLLFVTVAAVVHKPGDIDKQKAKDNCQYAGLKRKNQPRPHGQDASADNERLTKTKELLRFFHAPITFPPLARSQFLFSILYDTLRSPVIEEKPALSTSAPISSVPSL